MFSNHSVELNLDCQDQCALARECVSYNIGPKINNKMACELSNSDHFQHPEDLKPRKLGLDLQRDKGMIYKFVMYITFFLVITLIVSRVNKKIVVVVVVANNVIKSR